MLPQIEAQPGGPITEDLFARSVPKSQGKETVEMFYSIALFPFRKDPVYSTWNHLPGEHWVGITSNLENGGWFYLAAQ
jgi:hypothetical protein